MPRDAASRDAWEEHVKIGDLDLDQKVMIVAEAGVNHEGDPAVARKLVEQAAAAGADAIKFQTYNAERYFTSDDAERFARIKRFQLSHETFRALHGLASSLGLLFLSTPLDEESVDFLDEFAPAFKIASGEITHHRFLAYVAKKEKPIILSTGASTEAEVMQALETFRANGPRKPLKEWVALLHCAATYPAPPEAANLRSIDYLREKTGLMVGWSNHVLGITVCLAAVARGARIVEAHFTLGREGKVFRDHQLSLEPQEMGFLVKEVRAIEAALGGHWKQPAQYELEFDSRRLMRRGLSVARPLPAGAVLTEREIAWIRPATEFSVGEESKVIGRRLKRAIQPGELLKEDHLE